MNKSIKIQNTNSDNEVSYSANNIESVTCSELKQKVTYDVLDEYLIPLGTYVDVKNYDSILLDNAMKQTGDKIFNILEYPSMPDCDTVTTLYDETIAASNDFKGVVIIDKSNVVYNKIKINVNNISLTPTSELNRVCDIFLENEYTTLNDIDLDGTNVVILDFDDIFYKCSKYWKETANIKTSAFDVTQDTSLKYLPSFVGGFGDWDETQQANIEKWKTFTDTGDTSLYSIEDGKKYLTELGNDILDYDYNIFDVIYRTIYYYIYEDGLNEPILNNINNYTFLLKSYKMHVKQTNLYGGPFIFSYTTEVLSMDNIKTLDANTAQEYFNNTVLYDDSSSDTKLLLSSSEARQILINNNIFDCGKYFILPESVCNIAGSTDNFYNLGNFKLLHNNNIYVYNKNGIVFKIRYIYDSNNDEHYIISQNNIGDFSDGYDIQRNGVIVRGISGKLDYYYFSYTETGKSEANQFKEDILYAIEDGPSIVRANILDTNLNN